MLGVQIVFSDMGTTAYMTRHKNDNVVLCVWMPARNICMQLLKCKQVQFNTMLNQFSQCSHAFIETSQANNVGFCIAM